jgi:pSer/pThr/pTyr-binding forkhead associated (FHA) protein
MPPELVALTDGPNIVLDKPIVLLGRHQECDIQLGSRKVSRRHCCLAQVDDHLVVRDLGSTNGIRINGKRVTEGDLHPGDELTVGNQRYQLQWQSELDRLANAGNHVKAPNGRPHQEQISESTDQPVLLSDADYPAPIAAAFPVASPASVNGNEPES